VPVIVPKIRDQPGNTPRTRNPPPRENRYVLNARSYWRVLCGVMLSSFFGVMRRVREVSLRNVRMVPGLHMVAGFVMLRGFAVVLGCMLMVLGCLMMMRSAFVICPCL
jgi:hypothetical protein